MVPRGEVGIVVAQLGLGLGVVSDAVYGVVLCMAVGTTVIAPRFYLPDSKKAAMGGDVPNPACDKNRGRP